MQKKCKSTLCTINLLDAVSLDGSYAVGLRDLRKWAVGLKQRRRRLFVINSKTAA